MRGVIMLFSVMMFKSQCPEALAFSYFRYFDEQ